MTLLRHEPLVAPVSACSLLDTHLVRMACVAAAAKSTASGPPMSTGAPMGTARHTLVGRLMG
jgi:hypothetical protein